MNMLKLLIAILEDLGIKKKVKSDEAIHERIYEMERNFSENYCFTCSKSYLHTYDTWSGLTSVCVSKFDPETDTILLNIYLDKQEKHPEDGCEIDGLELLCSKVITPKDVAGIFNLTQLARLYSKQALCSLADRVVAEKKYTSHIIYKGAYLPSEHL